MRAAIYARVSTTDQHNEIQVAELTEYVNRRGWELAGVRFIATSQGIDTDAANPTSRLLLHILAAVAEFERELIRERVSAGLKHAKAKGTSIGRPRRVFDRQRALDMRQQGMSYPAIARALGIGYGTVVREIDGLSKRRAASASAGD